MKTYDTIIIGAGAAGLMAAGVLSTRKKSVLVLDMGDAPARKIAISGGGNCNFTNMAADYTHYFGKNPQFVRSALAQFSPNDTLNWVKSHKIEYVERETGRFFCKNGAIDIVNALMSDIKSTPIKYNTQITDITKNGDIFNIISDNGEFAAKSVIIANGGVSYPHLGVSNIGHVIAKKFGHKIEPIRPALCALKTHYFAPELSGIALPVEITVNKHKIAGDLLFTHFGIGGPATYRASLFDIDKFTINFAPNIDVANALKTAKKTNGKRNLVNTVSEFLPNKLARFLCSVDPRNIADYKDCEIEKITDKIQNFVIDDAKPIGMSGTEVTAGGISTDKISSKTMESALCSGLFFAGETMDVTGDLGGFNLQWAFASGFVAGKNC